jgi:hypothetical protein
MLTATAIKLLTENYYVILIKNIFIHQHQLHK